MERQSQGASTVNKALSVLEALAAALRGQPEGLTLSELGRASGFSPSSTYRYLLPLLAFGLVVQEPSAGRYRLGLRVVELAGICLQAVSLRDVARPFLMELTRQTRETAYLGVPDGLKVVYLDRMDTPLPLRPYTTLGGCAPLHCTALGKAMLAQDPALLARVVAAPLTIKTKNTIGTTAALMADLARARARGYAIDDLENEADMRCVAAAIRDHTGAIVGAISVSGPATRITIERIDAEIGPLVRATAHDISRAMGYLPGTEVGA